MRAVIFVSAIVFVASLFSANPVVYSDNPARLIESDDPLVLRQGNWTAQAASGASGGSYLYSSSPDDVLTLYFTGTTIEVVYVAGTTLGILALEVDGTVLRSVITSAETTQFGSRAKIDYLTDEGHTLRVYASQGVVAVDAFYGSVVSSVKSNDPTLVTQQNEERLIFCDGTTSMVSRSSTGTPGDNDSVTSSMSDNGRYVVFASYATNLVSDNNGVSDIFLRDRQTCATTRISVGPNGTQANGGSHNPVISGDGHFIAFSSDASNLVDDDTNGVSDIFVYDRLANTTARVSMTYTNHQAVGGGSYNPSISDNGRFVAFESTAYNLVPYGGTSTPNVYLHDTQAGTNNWSRTIKLSGGIGYHPSISADGRYIAFEANYYYPSGYYDIYLYDRISGSSGLISRPVNQPAQGNSMSAMISPDGNYIVFMSPANYLVPNDTNGYSDAFVYNRTTSFYARVSVSSGGEEANRDVIETAISDAGRYVTFNTFASNLDAGDTINTLDIFVHTLENDNGDGRTGRIFLGQAETVGLTISGDGRYIAFHTLESLSSIDTGNRADVYVVPSELGWTDTLALFNSDTGRVALIDSLQDNPLAESYTIFDSGVPTVAIDEKSQWVMGDWDGDGQKTPGVYAPNGVFYTTNVLGDATPAASWTGTWFGLINHPAVVHPAVVGRFSTTAPDDNDCLGVVDSGNFPPYGTAYALYYTCDLSGGDPPKSFQWLSVLLPDNQGHTGTAQFVAGDFDVDGFDSIAIRRSEFIAFNNVTPSQGHAEFSWAQYIGAPSTHDYGYFVAGDWDNTGTDSFGLAYEDGYFYRRNDLEWNTGQYILQRVNLQSFGTPITLVAASWRLQESYVGGQ